MLQIEPDTPAANAIVREPSGDATRTPPDAFAGWLAEARPRLARLARARGVVPDAIEDVVQETLLEAWTHQERLHTPAGVAAWLDEICRNICRRHARRHALEQRRLAPVPFLDDGGEGARAELALLPDPAALDPVEALSRQEMGTLLDRALGGLARQAREALELCYLTEVPQREAADRLGISLSALEARLHRARAQVRALLNGPLRADAHELGLALDAEASEGWIETRLWCTLCGQRRLLGMFLPQPDGGTNLHMHCPDCEQRYGLSDVHSSNVHSKGWVALDEPSAFRPAWKRTMHGVTERYTQALLASKRACPYCGGPAAVALVDKMEDAERVAASDGGPGLLRHPYQFWLWWHCPRCHADRAAGDVFAASDLVYWADARTQRFMLAHPRWTSESELLVEYAGQAAIRFQMVDVTSAARLTVLAQRQTLRILAVYG